MIESYNGGYRKALLDIRNLIVDWELLDRPCKSKKAYKKLLLSLLDVLLTNPEEFERFQSGLWKFKMDIKTKEIVPW